MSGINLSGQDLTGHLPASFGNIQDLAALDLSFNNILGPLPESLSRLVAMQSFSLQGNDLGQTSRRMLLGSEKASDQEWTERDHRQLQNTFIDPSFEVIAGMTSLEYLDISGNGLVGQVPASLCALPLTALITTTIDGTSENENDFSCIAGCLMESSILTIVAQALPRCPETAMPSVVPTSAPTGDQITTKSNPSRGMTSAYIGQISGIVIAAVVLFCCCMYCCIVYLRNNEDGVNHLKDDQGLERDPSINIMALKDIEAARQRSPSISSSSSASSSSASSPQRSVNDQKGLVHKSGSEDIGIECEDVDGTTAWDAELVDFHKGSVKPARKEPLADRMFSFADVYSSSDDEFDVESRLSLYSTDRMHADDNSTSDLTGPQATSDVDDTVAGNGGGGGETSESRNGLQSVNLRKQLSGHISLASSDAGIQTQELPPKSQTVSAPCVVRSQLVSAPRTHVGKGEPLDCREPTSKDSTDLDHR